MQQQFAIHDVYSSTENKWDYKGLEIIVSQWSLPNAAREILTF